MKVAEILLVEDNPGDVLLIRKAMERARLVNQLNVVEDGEAALEWLFRKGRYPDAPRPDLVLLDLNLPRVDGREVLRRMKSSSETASIPVVVLTSSEDEADVLRSYEMHASSFITKPPTLGALQAVLTTLHTYWFAIVKLPANGSGT